MLQTVAGRSLLAAAAVAAFVLSAAAPAEAAAPGGSAKPVPLYEYPVDFADEMHITCPSDDPALHHLTLTGTVTDIDQFRQGGEATPGTEVITFSNADGDWVTVRNANVSGYSVTTRDGVTTIKIYGNGLKDVVTTSDGVQGALTSAGHFETTYTIDAAGNVDRTVVSTGRAVDPGALCALAIQALS